MRVSRVLRNRKLIVVASAGLVASGISVPLVIAASGDDPSRPSTGVLEVRPGFVPADFAEPGNTVPIDTGPDGSRVLRPVLNDPRTSKRALAVAASLPGGRAIQSDQVVRSGRTVYNLVESRDTDGTGYEVLVYDKFALSDIERAGYGPLSVSDGRGWIGANEDQIQSVYVLSSSGRLVNVAYFSKPGAAHPSSADLGRVAAGVANLTGPGR